MGFVKLGENQWKRIEQDKAIIKHHGSGFTVMIRFLDQYFFRFHVKSFATKFKPALGFRLSEDQSFAIVESPCLSPEKEIWEREFARGQD